MYQSRHEARTNLANKRTNEQMNKDKKSTRLRLPHNTQWLATSVRCQDTVPRNISHVVVVTLSLYIARDFVIFSNI